jgi:hypothetical protein
MCCKVVLTELDVSDNQDKFEDESTIEALDGAGFAKGLAVGKKDNGALSATNAMGNCIGKEKLAKLQEIMRSKPNLVSLSGIAGNAPEADLSGLGMDDGGAAILVSELPDKGGLSVLSLKDNSLCSKEAGEALSEMPAGNAVLKGLGVSSKSDYYSGGAGFAHGLAVGLGDNGAVTSLNLALNNLRAGGAKIVTEAIKATKCTPVIILAPFSCPAGFSINCCCLLLSAGYEGDDNP